MNKQIEQIYIVTFLLAGAWELGFLSILGLKPFTLSEGVSNDTVGYLFAGFSFAMFLHYTFLRGHHYTSSTYSDYSTPSSYAYREPESTVNVPSGKVGELTELKCPHCGAPLHGDGPLFDCGYCKRRVIMNDENDE